MELVFANFRSNKNGVDIREKKKRKEKKRG